LHEPNHSRLNLPDEAATTAFAGRFARVLQPGLVIYLRGNLGAGKTTLVRALLQALGYTGRVKARPIPLLSGMKRVGYTCATSICIAFAMPKNGRVPDFAMSLTGKISVWWNGLNRPLDYCPPRISALLSKYSRMGARFCSTPIPMQDKNA